MNSLYRAFDASNLSMVSVQHHLIPDLIGMLLLPHGEFSFPGSAPYPYRPPIRRDRQRRGPVANGTAAMPNLHGFSTPHVTSFVRPPSLHHNETTARHLSVGELTHDLQLAGCRPVAGDDDSTKE